MGSIRHALEAAGVEFRLRHARAALERLDAVAPAAAPSAELVDDDDDDADSVAFGVEIDPYVCRVASMA